MAKYSLQKSEDTFLNFAKCLRYVSSIFYTSENKDIFHVTRNYYREKKDTGSWMCSGSVMWSDLIC